MSETTPTITFTADRTIVQPGEPVTFRWHVEGVKEVYFYPEGEDWRNHGVVGVAERQVRPPRSTTYYLRVVQRDDSVDVRGIEIRVQEGIMPAVARMFGVDRTDIEPGECVTFRWHVEGVREVYFYPEGEDWRGYGVVGVGEHRVCPAQTTTYRLRVVRLDGAVEEHGITVQVRASRPVFAVDRPLIRPGECVTLRWHVEGVREVYFYAEGEDWRSHGVAGVAERQVCPNTTTTYCLRIVKADGSLEVHYLTVIVSP